MTNDERFDIWVNTEDGRRTVAQSEIGLARKVWNAAAPPDDVREALLGAVEGEILDANDRLRRYAGVLPSRVPRARHDIERFTAARKWLEGE